MVTNSSYGDQRMLQIEQKIHRVGFGIHDLYQYISGLPVNKRRKARAALRKAFEVGCTFEVLRRVPVEPPISEDGTIVIGPEMRKHIKRARQVYGEVGQLREIVSRLLDDDAEEMIDSFPYN